MFNGRVLVITGAGVSAESGIPTFRGKDGYWHNLDPTKLATPEAFARDPRLVWEWYRERRQRIRAAKPNLAHEAITRLGATAREFLLVTQNVDDLHRRARWKGATLLPEKSVQIHGDIFLTRCSRCRFDRRDLEQDEPGIPKCPNCGALMRPAVVWFGEQLDSGEMKKVEMYLAAGACQMVLVVGTTALFGYIIDWAMRAAGENGRLIEVNPEETSLSPYATEVIREPGAVALPELVTSIVSNSS
jgi:NAD-dependent deacetylase